MAIANVKAVCIRCGSAKRHAPDQCPKCGFAPRSNDDLAKSFILSATFDVGDKTIGRSAPELSRIAEAIKRGAPYDFSTPEVALVAEQVASFRSIRSSRLLIDLVKWLGPPLLVIAIGYFLLRST